MNELTSLEIAVLRTIHQLHKGQGFPPPERIGVKARENTGAGRYVELISSDETTLADDYYDLGGQFIQMDGIPYGLMAAVQVANHQVRLLELAVYGNDSWDGVERAWRIL